MYRVTIEWLGGDEHAEARCTEARVGHTPRAAWLQALAAVRAARSALMAAAEQTEQTPDPPAGGEEEGGGAPPGGFS